MLDTGVKKEETGKIIKKGLIYHGRVTIYKTVDQESNNVRPHRYAKAGKPFYKVCRYDLDEVDDTWEPTRHFPRRKILSYYRKHQVWVL